VKKFMRAYVKATTMAIADPTAAAALKAIVPEIDVDVARAQFAASVPLAPADCSA
jgi:NitT/TauT family transport system substrate-binding protein